MARMICKYVSLRASWNFSKLTRFQYADGGAVRARFDTMNNMYDEAQLTGGNGAMDMALAGAYNSEPSQQPYATGVYNASDSGNNNGEYDYNRVRRHAASFIGRCRF